ncbi:MAG: InlB B-repeat-containing protein, partial [Clostridia bacterium]
SGTSYVAGDTFAMPAANVTLFAQWTALPTFTVTYDGNTNTEGMVPVDGDSPYLVGDLVTVLGNTGMLTKIGFSFVGWNTAANGSGTSYVAGDTFAMPAANVTLFAQWTALPTYTVTYNPGTQGTFEPQVTTGLLAGATTPTAPTVTGNVGYTFTGWSPTPTATVTGDATYTAQWAPIYYTVTFDSNGGDTNADPAAITTIMYGEDVGTLPVAPTRAGYTFNGWNTAANGSGTVFLATTPVTANITVYAQWIALPTYTVTYNPGTQGTFEPQVTTGLLAGATTPTAPTVTGNVGYTFTCWSPTPTAAIGSPIVRIFFIRALLVVRSVTENLP